MYSKEEKIQYLEALHSSGLTMSEAERKPGWPSRATLSLWAREARRGELPLSRARPKGYAGKRNSHGRYSDETKAQAIRLYEMGRRPSVIARTLGINCPANIRVWAKKGREEGRLPKDAFKPKPFGTERSEEEVKKKEIPPEVAALSEAELENACLRAVLADLKAGGWDPDSISNRKKTELGERLRRETGRALQEIIAFLKISKSSYEYHVQAMRRPDKNAETRKRIVELFWENKGVYGYRRIWGELRKEGVRVSEKVVRRIMGEEGITVFSKRRRKYSSYQGDITPEVRNLVKRDFHAEEPNELWLTDITEFKIPAGKVYLSPMLDCFDGALVSWTIGTSPDAELVNTMLDLAIDRLAQGEHPVVHNDQGAHYRWPGWIARMKTAGLIRSMSKKGCSPDNAACEGLFGRIKNEMFYYRSWRGVSIEEFIDRLNDYLHWYNKKRIKKSLGYLSPIEYRQSLGLAA
jgi:transposase InsO family protein/transposase-like protein